MQKDMEALRAGEIDGNEFMRRTWKNWVRLSDKLYKSYRLPKGVEAADVAQEMAVAAWFATLDWGPKHGSNLQRYVTWTAYAVAKRWVNNQRNSLRRADASIGRFPISESDLFGDNEFGISLGDLQPTVTSEESVDAKRIFSRLICSIADPGHVMALEAWAIAGTAESAAELLRRDPKVMSALKIWDPKAASRLVSQAIETAANIVGVA
jgi:hypothetical protein